MNYELLCEILLECLQDFRTEAKRLQADCNAFRVDYEALHKERDQLLAVSNGRKYKVEELQSNVEELQESNNQLQATLAGLQSDFNISQSEKTNLLLHRNSLQAENNKLILERDRLQSNFELAQSVVADLQLKNNEMRKLLKDRGVIVIDDSIVRENNNG